jgi:homoserine kinase
MKELVKLRVPATTANLGPGFDCLGMALDIWNQFEFSSNESPALHVNGEGAGSLSTGRGNLVYKAAERYFREMGLSVPSLSIACQNQIPLARGLGSSSSAIVGGLLGASAVAGAKGQDLDLVWRLAVEMEGHPDNVTPAIFGGCQVVVQDQETLVHAQVPFPEDLRAVMFIPDKPMPTDRARGILPPQVSIENAVYNSGRVALLVNALATGQLEYLRVATQDKLHQPFRKALMPEMHLLFRSALDAGAMGVFLSGAGPTVLALTQGRELTIAYEMTDMANKTQLHGQVRITKPIMQGAHITTKQ